ncbi:hypothetical protein BH24ACI4_BH24ACI4_29300 [soil metagenome]
MTALLGNISDEIREADISDPPCTLRIIDRFTINAAGEIVEQENYFDPRDLTHPGWRTT